MVQGPVYPKWMLRGSWPDGQGPVCTPGFIDDVARFLYRDRQSAFLALALHDRSGGQIWAALNRSDKDGLPSNIPGHFGVEVDFGSVYDIDGRKSLSEWKRSLASEAIPFSRKELRQWQADYQAGDQWMRPRSFREQYELANTFAEALLFPKERCPSSEADETNHP